MARQKRIFREWQHPRDGRGRFARKGSPEWVRAASEKFRAAPPGLTAGTAAPGRRIARGAKAEALFAQHDAGVTTRLGRQPVQGPARRITPGQPVGTDPAVARAIKGESLILPKRHQRLPKAARDSAPTTLTTGLLVGGVDEDGTVRTEDGKVIGKLVNLADREKGGWAKVKTDVPPAMRTAGSEPGGITLSTWLDGKKKPRPSTFELGDRSKSASGADAPPLKKLAAPGAGRTRISPAAKAATQVDTSRDKAQAGGMTSTTASNPRISAQDKRRIRIAVEDHAADFIGGPLGLGKDDAARYTSEGHLKDLVGKYGLSDVWDEVAHVIDTNPDLLKKTGRKDRTEARGTTSRDIADEALMAMKSGDFVGALGALNRGEDHDPDFRQNGRHSWNDMREVVLRRKAQADAEKAEKAQAEADKPSAEDLAVTRELYKLHPSQLTFDPKASNAARDEARAKAEAEVNSLLPSNNFSRSTLRARLGAAAGAVGAFQQQRDVKRAEIAQARELLAKIKDPKLRDEYRTGVLRPLEHDEEVLMGAIARQDRDLDRAREDLASEIKKGGQKLVGQREEEAWRSVMALQRSGGGGYGGGRGAEIADMVDAAPDRAAAIKALGQADRNAAQDETSLRGLHRTYMQKAVENALRGVDLKGLTPEERQRWADATGAPTRALAATLAARTRRDQALSRLAVLHARTPRTDDSPEMRTKLNGAITEERANLEAAQGQLATLEPRFQTNLDALTSGVNDLRAARGLKAAKLNTGTLDKGYVKTLERLNITPQENPPAPPAAPKGAIERASDTIAEQRAPDRIDTYGGQSTTTTLNPWAEAMKLPAKTLKDKGGRGREETDAERAATAARTAQATAGAEGAARNGRESWATLTSGQIADQRGLAKGDRTPLNPDSRKVADIQAVIDAMPADLPLDDQTRRTYLTKFRGTWSAIMEQPDGKVMGLHDAKTKHEVLDWIVNAQRTRHWFKAFDDARARGEMTPPQPEQISLRSAPRAATGATVAQRGLGKLTDEQLRNGITMRGNQTPEGKALQAELDRRTKTDIMADDTGPAPITSARENLAKADNPAADYGRNNRATNMALARGRGINVRGKDNDQLVAELKAHDEAGRARRAAKLNPGNVGTPSTQHEQHTPAAATDLQAKYEAFYEARSDGELARAAEIEGVSAVGKDRAALIRAIAAKRTAEDRAIETRNAVQNRIKGGGGTVRVSSVDRDITSRAERTGVDGSWKGGGSPKAEAASAAPATPEPQPTYRVRRALWGTGGLIRYELIRKDPDGIETSLGSGTEEGKLITRRRALEAEIGPAAPAAKLEKEEAKLRARLTKMQEKRAAVGSTRRRFDIPQSQRDLMEQLADLAPRLARSRREERAVAERANPRGLGGMTGLDQRVLDQLIKNNLSKDYANRLDAEAPSARANGTVPQAVVQAAADVVPNLRETADRDEFRRLIDLPKLPGNIRREDVTEVDASELRFGDLVLNADGSFPAQVTTITGSGADRKVFGLGITNLTPINKTGRVQVVRPKADAAPVAAAERTGALDTRRDSLQNGGVSNAPTTEANMAAPKPGTARAVPGGIEVVDPSGEARVVKTKRTNVNFVTFLGYSDGTWSATLSSATDEKRAIAAGRSTNPHAREYRAVPVEQPMGDTASVAPSAPAGDSIARHVDAPVSVDIFENGAGQLDVGPANSRTVYDLHREGGKWHADRLQGPTVGESQLSADTLPNLARKVAAQHGTSGTVSIEDERESGRSLSQRFEVTAPAGRTPVAFVPGRNAPFDPRVANGGGNAPRLEGETDTAYTLRTAPSDDAAIRTLNGYTVGGLRAIARDNKVAVRAGATKPQLVEAINDQLRRRWHDSQAMSRR